MDYNPFDATQCNLMKFGNSVFHMWNLQSSIDNATGRNTKVNEESSLKRLKDHFFYRIIDQ